MISTEAEKMLYKKYLVNVNILECLRRESAEVLFDLKEGILIRDKKSDIYMVSTEDKEISEKIIELIPENAELILANQKFYCEKIKRKCNLKDIMGTYHSVWEKEKFVEVPEFEGKIKILSIEEFDMVAENYSSIDLVGRDYIKDRLETGNMLGAFIDDKLCGFIGYHNEGSIGLLEVFPSYRKMGIGSILQGTAVNEAIKRGMIPFGEVKENNYKSLNLQKKLGFSIAKEKIYWIL